MLLIMHSLTGKIRSCFGQVHKKLRTNLVCDVDTGASEQTWFVSGGRVCVLRKKFHGNTSAHLMSKSMLLGKSGQGAALWPI